MPTAHAKLDLDISDLNIPVGYASGRSTVNHQKRLKIMRKLRGQYPIIEDPELNRWIRNLGNKIARYSSVRNKVHFLIARNSEVNAFATEGGVIVIHSGLILHTSSESELAAVIAHEIAHVSQLHITRLKATSKRQLMGTGAAVLAGILAGSKNAEVGGAIITTAMATQQHNILSFSREMESEADRVGIRLLSQAGFRASGMPDFMEKLDRMNDNPHAQLTKYLQSHPLSIERLSDTRSRANRLSRHGRESVDYLYAREKIRGLDRQNRVVVGKKSPALIKYAQAQKHMARAQYRAVLQVLGTRAHRLPEMLTIAKALNGSRQFEQTIALLKPHTRTYIGEPALLVPLSRALMGLGRMDEAWRYLSKYVPTEQTSLEFFEVKQEVARMSGHIGDAYIAVAERNIRIGQLERAKRQLEQAAKLPSVSLYELGKINALLSRL